MTVTESDLSCESCGSPTTPREIYMTMWMGSDLNLIEGVPAHVCERCGLQYFDREVEESIRALNAAGFPAYRAVRYITVPVFSLQKEQRDASDSPSSKPMEHS